MKFKVGDKVKLVYNYGYFSHIHIGIIESIESPESSYPRNLKIDFKKGHYLITKDGEKVSVEKRDDLVGFYFAYDSIEKVKDMETEVFFEVL
jgi:hypothetical protein